MRRPINTNRLFFVIGSLASAAQMIAQGPPWLEWLGWGLVALAALVLVFGARIEKDFHLRFGGPFWRRRVNPYAVVMAIGALVFVSAAIGYYADVRRGPLVWTFGASHSPLGTSRSSGGPLWIDAFQIKGRNRSDDPISPKSAVVRSDTTNRTLVLKFSDPAHGLVPVNEATIIPGGAFTLIGVIPPTDHAKSQGIVSDAFREEFERFTFIFEYDDQKFTRRFSAAEVEGFLATAD